MVKWINGIEFYQNVLDKVQKELTTHLLHFQDIFRLSGRYVACLKGLGS